MLTSSAHAASGFHHDISPPRWPVKRPTPGFWLAILEELKQQGKFDWHDEDRCKGMQLPTRVRSWVSSGPSSGRPAASLSTTPASSAMRYQVVFCSHRGGSKGRRRIDPASCRKPGAGPRWEAVAVPRSARTIARRWKCTDLPPKTVGLVTSIAPARCRTMCSISSPASTFAPGKKLTTEAKPWSRVWQ